ncbi:GNAT family N-acetyltransferase [Sutcliffiella halmapala]|uniref:GNAT family N-acetyltransferase n=1 Tax=Sutcliffiella halmapala TaxID=79882 RepID=UPI000995B382|nr:GNAT family N-acetyltransferase [Sutcliffiella halmapala]
MSSEVKLCLLKTDDLIDSFLQSFNRYQETKHVYVYNGRNLTLQQEEFTDEWDEAKKRQIVAHLRETVKSGGAVISARQNGRVIGFSVIEPEFFGEEDAYLELSYLHISADNRGQGIGEQLFKKTLQTAKEIGAIKLYIGAHPAVETQEFYKKMGCIPAKEINRIIYKREPRDIQLEVTCNEIQP